MSNTGRHWSSEALILFGLWLWERGEYGHAMLCIHAPNWGFKIGEQLKLQWAHVIDGKTGKCLPALREARNQGSRPIRNVVKANIEKAYKVLKIKDIYGDLYVNAKTGKPLTSSTLNRELQRLAKQFLAYVKERTGIELPFKEIKTNAFEIAWAKDITRANNYIPEVYPVLSRYMGHRTVKDTLALLEEEAGAQSLKFGFDLLSDDTPLVNENLLEDESKLTRFVERNLYLGIEE